MDRSWVELDTSYLSRKGIGEIEVDLKPGFYEAFSTYTRQIEHRVVFEITLQGDIRLLGGIGDIAPSPKTAAPTQTPTIEIIEWGGEARATRGIGQVFRDPHHGNVQVVTQTAMWCDDPESFGFIHAYNGYLVTLGCVPAASDFSEGE